MLVLSQMYILSMLHVSVPEGLRLSIVVRIVLLYIHGQHDELETCRRRNLTFIDISRSLYIIVSNDQNK